MKGFLDRVEGLSRYANVLGGISLMSIVFLTLADVVLRFFRRPIPGAYELVCFLGAFVFAFALPYTSWKRQQIFVDFFINNFSRRARAAIHVVTRCLVTFLFVWLTWNLMSYGADLLRSGELTTTLHLPFFPVPYMVGICCALQCLVVFCDLIKILRGTYE
jgi:TRAP-type C4-dicarboxylate transport system permease small subunit